MHSSSKLFAALAAFVAALAVSGPAVPARAEVKEVRLAKQHGLGYLPLIVMEEQKLIEKQARAAGLGDLKVTWATLGGGSATNDALLSGSVDYISSGVTPMILLWAKSGGSVKGVAGLDTTPLFLNSTNPAVRSVKDFTEKDRIALPSVKISIQAVLLQMAAAQAFGPEGYAKLDPLTVTMKHPDGMAALLSGRSEITAHFTNPPFMYQELDDKRVRTVLDSRDVVGGPHTTLVLATTTDFHDKNRKTYAAVLAALEEAVAYIQKDKRGAAEIYLKATRTKESLNDLQAQIAKSSFSTTPHNITRFSDFMYQTGSIKVKPRVWKELFFSNIHQTKGS